MNEFEENDGKAAIILSQDQALIYYGVESSKPFQINANLANVGDMLRHARENKEISIELLSGKINLDPHILRQLESNRYQNLAGETFIKGYLNLVARELGADSEPLLLVYDAQKRRNSEAVEDKETAKPQDHWESKMVFWIALIALIVATGIYYLGYSNKIEKSGLAIERQLKSLEEHESERLENLKQKEITLSSAKTPNTIFHSQDGRLIINVKKTTWIEIVDDLGVVLYKDLANANQKLELLGRPPYNLLIGDGSAIDIEFQGEIINISDGVDSTGVARFRLGSF